MVIDGFSHVCVVCVLLLLGERNVMASTKQHFGYSWPQWSVTGVWCAFVFIFRYALINQLAYITCHIVSTTYTHLLLHLQLWSTANINEVVVLCTLPEAGVTTMLTACIGADDSSVMVLFRWGLWLTVCMISAWINLLYTLKGNTLKFAVLYSTNRLSRQAVGMHLDSWNCIVCMYVHPVW